jgi:hypothetical protein
MNCYFCEQDHSGGTRYGIKGAIGVCQHCGVGVCLTHSHKARTPGAPLLCLECEALLQATEKQLVTAQQTVPEFA